MELLNYMLRRFVRTGTLRVIDASGRQHVHAATDYPQATIRLRDTRLYRALFFNPELRAGEAYMDESLTIEEGTLRDFLLIFALNRTNLRSQPLQQAIRATYRSLRQFYQHNPAARARKNVAHHYDVSNELYRLFLDSDLNYSCAYFLKPDDSLEAAQQNKLRLVAAKLLLRPGLKVLDIGSGWGGLAMFLAEKAGVEVTGVTLSREQHELATRRAHERGLADRVRFELKDYREVSGTYDRIVSVGMFEHVGVGHYPEFFAKVASLLAADGVALLHSIGRKGGPGSTGAWVRKYIFPGGYSPALSETLAAIERSQLWVTDIEILRLHYAETLLAWERRFQIHRAAAAALLDERFCRMWEFYLIASEFSFRYGKHMVFQIQLAKAVDAVPLTRGYIAAAEADLAMRARLEEHSP
ncbi:MAG: cyclopropane-fatty-acyl-phospholipid synthase family protein [Pseudomonadota bacterium]|nr:cyclopropane-fatty-acyl-phospholipid synthase family protein [Pseudomonadota bacterium]